MFERFRRAPLRRKRAVRAQQYDNELFPRPRGAHGQKIRRGIVLSVTGLLVIGILFLLTAPSFTITTITVEGTHRLHTNDLLDASRTALRERRFGFFGMRNYFLLSEERFAQRLIALLAPVAAVDAITVKKRFPRTVILTVQERQPVAIYESLGAAFLLDRDGRIVQELAPDAPDKPGLTLVDQNPLPVRIGENPVKASLVASLPIVHDGLTAQAIEPARFLTARVECPPPPAVPTPAEEEPAAPPAGSNTNASIANAAVRTGNERARTENVNAAGESTAPPCDLAEKRKASSTLIVETGKRWQILFDTDAPIQAQLDKLVRFRSEKLQGGDPKRYLDLRFQDFVYYQ